MRQVAGAARFWGGGVQQHALCLWGCGRGKLSGCLLTDGCLLGFLGELVVVHLAC